MLFTEFRFFWFFLAVFAVYWSLRRNSLANSGSSFAATSSTRPELSFFFRGVEPARLRRRRDAGADGDLRARRGWLLLSLGANLGVIAFFQV
jgi:hypothetical protein